MVENVGLEPLSSIPNAVCYHYTTFSIFQLLDTGSWARAFPSIVGKAYATTQPHYKSRISSWKRNSIGYLAHRCLCLETQHYYPSFYIAFAASLFYSLLDVRGTFPPEVVVDAHLSPPCFVKTRKTEGFSHFRAFP